MHLESALGTSKFRSEQHKLLLHILHTRSHVHLESTRRLKPWDITPEQYNVLRILRGQRGTPMAIRDLASRMIDPTSNASRLVEKLKTKELLYCIRSQRDRRQIDVRITEKGLRCLEAATDRIQELEKRFEDCIPNSLAKKLNEALDCFHSQPTE